MTGVYRADLLTRAYPEVKTSLLGAAVTHFGKSEGVATVETEPWFNMEAAWMPVRGSERGVRGG